MAGKFVLKKGTTGKFRFNLLASNGQVIATSKAYESKSTALKGIESVRKNAREARLEDETESRGKGGASRSKSISGSTVGRALARDWEQTKADLPGLKGKDINQNIGDTVEQAAGEKSAPPKSRPNRGS